MTEVKDFSMEVLVTDNFGRPKVLGNEYEKIHIDLSSSTNLCPICLCISYKERGENWWVCPNQNCGTLRFHKGWQKTREQRGFLDQVEVEGWEYTHGS